jgi:hypothetical protein
MAISIISPLALGASDVPPEQATMTVADSTGDSRMVLIELRLDAGSYADDVRDRFEALWRDVLANSPSVPAATLIAALGVEHREEGVEAFGQERVGEDRVRHGGVGELAQHGDLGWRYPRARRLW